MTIGAELSQGSPGESAERSARELFETTAASNVQNGAQETVAACDEVVRRFGESEIPAVLLWVAKALVNKVTVLPRSEPATGRAGGLRRGDPSFRGRANPRPFSERVATALVNKGAVLGALNRPQDTLEAYDEVIRRFGKSETPALLERVAAALVNKGAVLGDLNRPQDALEACDEVIRRFGKSDSPALLEGVATALGNRGAALSAAEPAAGRAGSLRRGDPSIREERDPRPSLSAVASTLAKKGVVLGDLNRPQDALEAYDEVIRRFGKSETPALLEEVATALGNKGAVLGDLNRLQDALESLRRGGPSIREERDPGPSRGGLRAPLVTKGPSSGR